MKKNINTKHAPLPIGPYSQAVLAGNTLYVSGQIAINPETNELVIGDVSTETTQVMKNINMILKEAGAEFEDILKTSIYLKNMNDFAEVNKVYGSFFTDNYPARETVEVAHLPKDVNVEISVIAFLENV
jgi:2-iminobutanoate/2-iminopropanoate deaminase